MSDFALQTKVISAGPTLREQSLAAVCIARPKMLVAEILELSFAEVEQIIIAVKRPKLAQRLMTYMANKGLTTADNVFASQKDKYKGMSRQHASRLLKDLISKVFKGIERSTFRILRSLGQGVINSIPTTLTAIVSPSPTPKKIVSLDILDIMYGANEGRLTR